LARCVGKGKALFVFYGYQEALSEKTKCALPNADREACVVKTNK